MSANRCHRVKCKTKERCESVIFVMAQKGIGPLYPEFCGLCRAWHAVRAKNHHNLRTESREVPVVDSKMKASGDD